MGSANIDPNSPQRLVGFCSHSFQTRHSLQSARQYLTAREDHDSGKQFFIWLCLDDPTVEELTFIYSSILCDGAAETYRTLLQRMRTSPRNPANCPSKYSSHSDSWRFMYASVLFNFPWYSIPHLSFTFIASPCKSNRKGLGLTMSWDCKGKECEF